MPQTYKDIRRADRDWRAWVVPAFIALLLVGVAFEASHHDPWVAVIGLVIVFGIIIPLRQRQLRRRMDEAARRVAEGSRNP